MKAAAISYIIMRKFSENFSEIIFLIFLHNLYFYVISTLFTTYKHILNALKYECNKTQFFQINLEKIVDIPCISLILRVSQNKIGKNKHYTKI